MKAVSPVGGTAAVINRGTYIKRLMLISEICYSDASLIIGLNVLIYHSTDRVAAFDKTNYSEFTFISRQ